MVTVEELIKFESQIGDLFNNKQIKAPIHLYSGNEEKMIEMHLIVEKDKENEIIEPEENLENSNLNLLNNSNTKGNLIFFIY